ncbi:4-oxalocrotonate tautomerase [hydrocarbon metagenome]|uniref:4-oxalocrotonate tautomerase n=1 Tax=hydrocarbon metagenome TaxID=938273 RepID=A0A0W8FFI8_9ZZZZ|nr:tautomerase family protein [Methanomicrobiaceae archaeon]
MPVVTVQMAKGRTLEQKKRIAEEITHSIVSALNVDPGKVTVLIHELDRENIAQSGRLLSES